MRGTDMKHASIVVDLRHIRCDNCKVAIHDELASECLVCEVKFDGIVSNHVGLAAELERRRERAGNYACSAEVTHGVLTQK